MAMELELEEKRVNQNRVPKIKFKSFKNPAKSIQNLFDDLKPTTQQTEENEVNDEKEADRSSLQNGFLTPRMIDLSSASRSNAGKVVMTHKNKDILYVSGK